MWSDIGDSSGIALSKFLLLLFFDNTIVIMYECLLFEHGYMTLRFLYRIVLLLRYNVLGEHVCTPFIPLKAK